MATYPIAVACQGGGAQTAFTAGVLHYFLYILGIEPALPEPPYPGAPAIRAHMKSLDRHGEGAGKFQIVALSGTSGGAMSATMAWDELITRKPQKLEEFWLGGYPSGNAAVRCQEAWKEDLRAFGETGEWPWLRLIDRLRVEFGLWMLEDPPFMQLLPFHMPIEFKPYYFANLFNTFDQLVPPFVSSWIDARRSMSPSFVAQSLELNPLYRDSTLRREFDTQDLFRKLLRDTLALDVDTIQDRLSEEVEWKRKRDQERKAKKSPEPQSGQMESRLREIRKKTESVEELQTFLEPDERHRVDRTNFRAFKGKEHLDSVDSLIDCMLASAAIPVIMRGPIVDGAVHWDGLFSQNPPVYDLPDVQGAESESNPSQIWVIRINPMEVADVPKTSKAIDDRRNELAGNLSLLQEIRAIEKLNGVIKCDKNDKLRVYHPVAFGFIDMAEDFAEPLDYASKVDRRIEKLWLLYRHGHGTRLFHDDRRLGVWIVGCPVARK